MWIASSPQPAVASTSDWHARLQPVSRAGSPSPTQRANVVAFGLAHGGNAALQLGHARLAQGLGDGKFFGAAERYARRLFAVA